MNKNTLTVLIIAATFSSPAYSRNTTHFFNIQEAMNTPEFKEKLDSNIHFYFGKQTHPKVIKSFRRDVSNKKTNAFNKSDDKACKWALLSTLLSFQERVKSEGGNAVINIESYYKKKTFISETEYECHAGALMAGVALRGQVVKIAE